MRLVVSGRMMGKTHASIDFMRAHPDAEMYVHSVQEANRLCREYEPEKRWHLADRIFSVGQAVNGTRRGRRRPSHVVVENLDIVLPMLLHLAQPVYLATATASACHPSEFVTSAPIEARP